MTIQPRMYQQVHAHVRTGEQVSTMKELADAARLKHALESRLSPWGQAKATCKRWHDGDFFQQLFGVIIVLSFIISLVRSEMVPAEGSDADDIFQLLGFATSSAYICVSVYVALMRCGTRWVRDW